MKICWNNLENIHLTRYGKFKKKGAVYIEGCMYYQLKCIKEDYEHEQR
jgi:hypothetical protein